MEPKHLSFFLGKHSKLPTPKRHLKAAVEMFLGVENVIKDVSFKDGTLHIKASGVVKQELFVNKKKAIDFLNGKNLGISITEIL